MTITFTIWYKYKTGEPRSTEISASIFLGFVVVRNKHVLPRSKMTVSQTYNKRYRIFNVVIWIEILQLHRYTIMVFTWLYTLDFKENFQSIEEHGGNTYTCSFFLAGLFTCFSAWMRWCVLKILALPPVKHRKTFFLATLNQPLIDFKYIEILEILSSWRLGSDAWPVWNKMLCMICYMLCCTRLHDRHCKSDFFFFWFYLILELLSWYMSKIE